MCDYKAKRIIFGFKRQARKIVIDKSRIEDDQEIYSSANIIRVRNSMYDMNEPCSTHRFSTYVTTLSISEIM
jgi:hypothetical protein